ncbi:CYTH domain-containing protein [Candidatus Woesearchaeota archaeon]|jgi:predicted adenylyl cyclase CyaB|nr:CYTH domain-containing protein [Candidatus Woesearchaeota archaeon]MBT4368048.1 CYTH domain-containing protein [Candidatus Woesearchaeota archaeon]MBT4712536.1 CYTH domain-containing protein [Candidatus Woesearchaeota archaeon]MBT6639449.1 CYTH domain-containing protein [Candidatus Woesearchaeota archaeon]MBT7133621.1 CYTH domain-containing protein [Candidatus Woesearchaeota archaeon]
MIEVEIKSFISKEQYDTLLDFFKTNAELEKEDYQETFYFDCKEDLRIQKNNLYSKITMKKGIVHDEQREEIEIKFKRDEFEKLEKLFLSLGYNIEIKWFRNRTQFIWEDITVCLDFTKGYGHIIEMEKMCEENNEEELTNLKNKLKSLNIILTPREEFEEKFQYYKNNWQTLTN